MDDDAHRLRTASLGAALERLSAARERRGPVGLLDPLDLGAWPEAGASQAMPRAAHRRGLFRFSQRAQRALDA